MITIEKFERDLHIEKPFKIFEWNTYLMITYLPVYEYVSIRKGKR